MAEINRDIIAAAKQPLLQAGSYFELVDVTTPEGSYKAFANAPKSLIEILQAGRAHGDSTLFVYEEERWSYAEFYRQVDALRQQLTTHYGVQPGDSFAIAMKNYPEWLVAFTASALVGAVSVPLNSWGKTEELKFGLEDCAARLLFCDPERYQLIEQHRESIGVDIIVARSQGQDYPLPVRVLSELIAEAGAGGDDVAAVEPDTTAVILYTSGSTGYPKGVILTHRIMGQCLMNMYFGGALSAGFMNPALTPKLEYPGCTLITVPLFHGTGLWGSFFVPLQLGQKIVLINKWDATVALQKIETEGVTSFVSVPAIVRSLLLCPEFDQYETKTLTRFSFGGAATPSDLAPMLAEKLGYISRATGWGMTETCSVGSAMGEGFYDFCPDSTGLQSPIIELRMVDANGAVLAAGGTGEIECRGVTTTPGYWRNQQATDEIYHDGWLRTGDVGRFDDNGFLHITGRVKEIVIRGGENIFPGEIEDVAYQLDPVEEVVVFGVPDAAMGEELVLVYYRGAKPLAAAELRAHLKQHVGGFKVPKFIVESEQSLPQNVSNKLNKKLIREQYLSSHGLA